MSSPGHTAYTEQRILNDAFDATYTAHDVIPFVETTQGAVAARLTGTASGAKVALDVNFLSGGANGNINLAQWNGVAPAAAAALADGVSSTAVEPRIAADMQGLRSDGTANSDRAILSKSSDHDTAGTTEMVVHVSQRIAASGGSIAPTYGTGVRAAGTQRVTIATDDIVPASQSGTWTVGLTAGGVVNPIPVGTALTTYSIRLTTNATTTPTAATAYISTIAISTEAVGTGSTIKIQDKQGTPLVLVPAQITTAVGLVQYNFQTPVKMVSGIDIVTAGAVAATVDVWINYYA